LENASVGYQLGENGGEERILWNWLLHAIARLLLLEPVNSLAHQFSHRIYLDLTIGSRRALSVRYNHIPIDEDLIAYVARQSFFLPAKIPG